MPVCGSAVAHQPRTPMRTVAITDCTSNVEDINSCKSLNDPKRTPFIRPKTTAKKNTYCNVAANLYTWLITLNERSLFYPKGEALHETNVEKSTRIPLPTLDLTPFVSSSAVLAAEAFASAEACATQNNTHNNETISATNTTTTVKTQHSFHSSY